MSEHLTNYLIVPSISALHALQNHTEGECVYCEEDSKIYSWQENVGWEPINFENKGISMNLYELNKNIVNQLKPMTNNDITKKMDLFKSLQLKHMNIHYMLLCKDYNYYTIFESDPMTSIPNFSVAVCDIISKLGKVMSIETTETEDAVEIWIIPEGEENAFAFYLFPYDAGVVYYG